MFKYRKVDITVHIHGGSVEKAYKTKISGKVQRVGYRRFVLEAAQEIGVSGYVRNEPDGSVTVFVQGEEGLVEQFLVRIREPPPPITIKSFEVKDSKLSPKIKFFRIEFGSFGEELQEGFGSMEREFRDYRQEFRGFVGEFRDYRQEFRGFVGEFRDYRQEFRGFAERTDKNFQALAEKYGEISEKLTLILETLRRESDETRRELTRAVDSLTELIKHFIRESSPREGSSNRLKKTHIL
jgi:acylphosphatase